MELNKVLFIFYIHILLVDQKEFIATKPSKGTIIDTKGCW